MVLIQINTQAAAGELSSLEGGLIRDFKRKVLLLAAHFFWLLSLPQALQRVE
jgi:hypothetical protein